MRKNWQLLVVLTGLLLGIANIGSTQGIGIFLHHDRAAEYTAGAGLNLLSRGPWIAKGWRSIPVRFIMTQTTSLAYERLFDYNGFNWSDYRQRLYGYLVTETGIELFQIVKKAL